MSFDAGSILGKLGLDVSEFVHNLDDAGEHASEGAAHIGEMLGSLSQLAGSFLGGVGGEVLSGIGEMVSGISSGNGLEALSGMAEAAKATGEGVFEVGERFHAVGLAAEKTGTSVEWMSHMAGVASIAHVGIDQLVAGFGILEQRAALALEGDKGAVKGFERLGISVAELRNLQDAPQELFERVQRSIEEMSNAEERAAAAKGVMSRAGLALIPVLSMSKEEVDKITEAQDRMGATITETDVKMGESMTLFDKQVHDALFSVEKNLAVPVLKYLQDHMTEVTPKLVSLTKDIAEGFHDLKPVFDTIESALSPLINLFQKLWDVVSGASKAVGEWAGRKQAVSDLGYDPYDKNQAIPMTVVLHNHFNPHETAQQVAEKLTPQMRQHYEQMKQETAGAAQAAVAEKSIGVDPVEF